MRGAQRKFIRRCIAAAAAPVMLVALPGAAKGESYAQTAQIAQVAKTAQLQAEGEARQSLPEMLIAALKDAPHAGIPAEARIRFAALTPVRGLVESVSLSRYDPRTGRFDATVRGGSVERAIAGRALVEIAVPTPLRTIAAGEAITADLLGETAIPFARISGDMVRVSSALIGKEARRSLAAGRPVSEDTIGAPVLVKRNAAVMLTYDNPHMRLTAKGRALEEGAAGDLVKAVNLDGSSVVFATVVGPGRLSVVQ